MEHVFTIDKFAQADIRAGTIIEAALNPKAKKPALVLTIDLGALGTKTSSAQLVENYSPEDLVGTQVIVVANLPPRRVAGVVSEVLVLATLSPTAGTILLRPDNAVENGARVA